MKSWIEEELSGADLGDERRNKRMKQMLESLASNPSASVKSAMGGWAETTAAYRFFDNAHCRVQKLLEPHQQATLERVRQQERVLSIQDTSELDYSRQKTLEGKGPLNDPNRQGFLAHTQLIVTPERLPLGVWGASLYTRQEEGFGDGSERKYRPIEEKESHRWLEGYRDACALAQDAPQTQVIACADRESDIYEIFEEWAKRRERGEQVAEWIIRANQDRCLAEGESKKLREAVASNPVLATIGVRIEKKETMKKVRGSRRKVKRSARDAELEVRATRVKLSPPYRKGKRLSKVSLWVVSAREIHPPAGEDPIHWLLLTSLPARDGASAIEILQLYLCRWEIEVFFRVLKTGCRVEELQLKQEDRVRAAIALYLIVAWRVLYAMKLGRECPDLPCDVIFDEDEWQSVWFILQGPKGLQEKPRLGEFVREVAKLGGFLGRKRDGHPGPQAIWQGMSRVRDFAFLWHSVRPWIPPSDSPITP